MKLKDLKDIATVADGIAADLEQTSVPLPDSTSA
jgi:hypothetical protein